MPVDYKGTQPGLVTTPAPAEPTINMKCKNHRCQSVQAIQVKVPGLMPGQNIYRCAECGTTWTVSVGGEFLY